MLFEIFQNGINLGGWLSQYEFLLTQPLSEETMLSHLDSFITESDIRQIAEWGFNHVRLPISGYLLYDTSKRQLNQLPLIS